MGGVYVLRTCLLLYKMIPLYTHVCNDVSSRPHQLTSLTEICFCVSVLEGSVNRLDMATWS